MDTTEALAKLRQDPSNTGIFTDFDGTISPIVPRPEDAYPVAGVGDAITDLAQRFALVAVVSGRSLDDLRLRLHADGVLFAGTYGRERSDGTVTPVASVDWPAVAARAVSAALALGDVRVEEKVGGVAFHYRGAPERADAVDVLASTIARAFALEVRPGRLVRELVAPGPGKADAIVSLITERGLRSALVAGDDVADLEAFEAVRSLDVDAVIVAVASDEAPTGLERLANLALPGPEAFAEFLKELAKP